MKKETSIKIGKSLLAAVPYIGGSVTSYISDIQAERKLKRIDELIISLGVDLHGLEEKIRKEFVEKDDYKYIIEETFRKVAQERTIEKRIAYKNILLNSMVDNSLDYDELIEWGD